MHTEIKSKILLQCSICFEICFFFLRQCLKTVIADFITFTSSSSSRGYSYSLMVVLYGAIGWSIIFMKKKGSLKVRKKRMLLFSLVRVYIFEMITTKLLTHSQFYSLKKKEHNLSLIHI